MEFCLIHSFPHIPILHPLKASEKKNVFRRYKIGTFGRNVSITKYNKLILTRQDLLTFKIIVLFIVTRKNMEIWAVKLRFLLSYENMLKSIATARSECTTKHENKASYNTDYIVPDLIDFFGDDWKEIKTQTEKEIFIIVKNIVLTKNWFVVSNFWELPKHHTKK